MTVCCWYSLKRGVPIYLPTVDHLQGVGVLPYPCAGDFPSVGRLIPPRCPISERTVPQSKTPLQGVNESLPPSAQMAVQPGGVSRFTIDLNDAFRFGTLSSGGRKFGCQRSQRSFAHWFTSRCTSAGGSPVLGRPRASRHFSFAHSIKTNRYALFLCVKMWYNGDINRTLVAPPGLARQFCLTNEPVQI